MTKILLVEDDKSLREIYGVRLLAEGYDIVSAGDGEEALAMAIKDRPSLIISDVMMPKISGFDMLDILRSTTETKDIRVIMMTALSSEDQRKRGEQLGADKYLVKSQVGIEDVVRAVHEVLGDAPTTSSTGQNPFQTPTAPPAPISSATPPVSTTQNAPRPAPVVPDRPTSVPISTPAANSTPAAAPQPMPVPVSVPEPTPAPTPTTPSTPSQSDSSTLPQPTAPFSTPRPASLADRIIQPLSKPEDEGEPIGNLIDKELGSTPPEPAPVVPIVPTPEPTPAPTPVAAPQPTPPAPAPMSNPVSGPNPPQPQ